PAATTSRSQGCEGVAARQRRKSATPAASTSRIWRMARIMGSGVRRGGFGVDGHGRGLRDAQERRGHGLGGVGRNERADLRRRGRADGFPFVAALPRALHSVIERVFGRRGGEEAGRAVVDDFAVAADVGHDRNASAEHGLDEHQRQAFAARGEDEAVMLVPDRGDVANESAEGDGVRQPEVPRHVFESRALVPAAVERDRDRPVPPFVAREDAQQEVLAFFLRIEKADAGEAKSVALRGPVGPPFPRHEERVADDRRVRQRHAELFLGETAVVLGDEEALQRGAVDRAHALAARVDRPVQVGRFLHDEHVRQVHPAAEVREIEAVVIAALGDDHEVGTGRAGEAEPQAREQQAVAHRKGEEPDDGRGPARQDGQPLQVVERARELAQAADRRLLFVEAFLERGDSVPVGDERRRGSAPELFTAAPGGVAADENETRHRREILACAALSSAVIRRRLAEVIRAGEWWEYKLAPIFAAFYATALTLRVPVISRWSAALTILLALVPGAAYVSVINDLTDRADDLAAGKPNRLAGRSRGLAALLVCVPVAAGLVFAVLWRHDVLLLPLYLAAWLAFSLYSLPPFRWKTRGILGVIADASGAHLFPTLVAVVLTYREAARPVD